jgi:IS5 family transposase
VIWSAHARTEDLAGHDAEPGGTGAARAEGAPAPEDQGARRDRLFCEQLDYNLLFRWFLDMDMLEESFDHSTFSKNRERLLEHDVAKKFLVEIVQQARTAQLMSDDHFTVDGTLIEAWASLRSFRPKGEKPEDRPPPDDPGNPTVNFHGEKRSNETHESTTDPESRLYRKGRRHEAKLSYIQEIFGWAKTVACFRKTRFRGLARTQLAAHLVAAAYNLLRISKLMPT